MKKVLAVLAAVAIVALTATVIYQGTSWAATHAKLDRTERSLNNARDRNSDLTSQVGSLESEIADMKAAEEADELMLTLGYHDPDSLARSYKRSINSEPGPKAKKVMCIAQDDENREFVCMITFDSGNRYPAKVDVAADGNSWVARDE